MASNRDAFGNLCSGNRDEGETDISGSSSGESKGFYEGFNDNIVDRLPADPFGMEIRSTLTAAITSWIHDFENDFGSEVCVFSLQDGDEKNKNDQQHLFRGLNWVCNASTSLLQEEGKLDEDNLKNNQLSIPNDDFNGYEIGNGYFIGSFLLNDEGRVLEDDNGVCCKVSEEGAPNDALFFALGYLGVKDLLAVEMVCRSLRDAVRSDNLLWRTIHIEYPYCLTDDDLLRITSRAQGTLEHLWLVGCFKITDAGLKRVLESNPRLTKLCVAECIRISIEGILFNLRAFKSTANPGIKRLRIGGCFGFGITETQFNELKFLLGVDNNPIQLGVQKPRFIRHGQMNLTFDDDRAIDIEACPKCQELRQVYDCPSESCRRTNHATQLCRACILCMKRCICCGCCLKDGEYAETFCLDLLCFDCWKQMDASSSKHTIVNQDEVSILFLSLP